jgi:alcohol dehydrogenase class IV
MMPSFQFTTAGKIMFGHGSLSLLPKEARSLGSRALLVTGGRSLAASGRLNHIRSSLLEAGVEVLLFDRVEPEPSTDTVDAAICEFCRLKADLVIGIGGGSALDVAKAVAGLAQADCPARDYVAGEEVPPRQVGLIAVPTTSGTGTEVTRVSVLSDKSAGVKVGIRADSWVPDVALVDPDLTLNAPPTITAQTGMDAFVQAIESYISSGANPFTDPFALKAVGLIAASLPAAYRSGSDREARDNMALGSLMAGVALANARLGLVHGLAHPIGARTGAHHGLICALLLNAVLEYNLPSSEHRLAQLAREVGAVRAEVPSQDAAAAFLPFCRNLLHDVGIGSTPEALRVSEDQMPALITETLASGSTKSNPRPVSAEDARAVLEAALR